MMKPLNIMVAGLSLLMATGAQAADDVYLWLQSNGTDIKNESISKGREGAIECLSYEQDIETTNGQRRYQPLIIRKRIDKSSPLLMKAMLKNEILNATFKFFREDMRKGGTEQFYTVTLPKARIVSVNQVVPDKKDNTNSAPFEEVAFIFSQISWTYTNGGVTMEDDAVQMGGEARSISRGQNRNN